MAQATRQSYEFDDFCVDVTERLLLRQGETVPIPPKVFDTLLVLVEHHGHILEKDALMKMIWPDSYVEESSLTQYIFQLRKALGEDAAEHRYIETIPRRGYRFVASVREVVTDVAADAVSPATVSFSGALNNGSVAKSNGTGITTTSVAPETALPGSIRLPRKSAEIRGIFSRNLSPWKIALVASLVTMMLVAGGTWAYRLLQSRQGSVPGQHMHITRLTAIGKALMPAISPDGKYVACVIDDTGRQSIWVRQIATGGNVQVVSPAEVDYQGITFSRDGNYLYYTVYDRPKRLGVIYRVPVLGGPAQKIMVDADSPITFSPDGKQFAFERNYPARLEYAILVADADGNNAHKLATRKRPDYFATDGPAWSPDGQVIACAAGSIGPNGPYMNVVGVRVADGQEVPLSAQQWARVGQVAWRRENDGLIAIALPQAASVAADQIWHLPYPQGEPQRITNDLNSYSGLSADPASTRLVTTQVTRVSHMWLVPDDDSEHAVQLGTVSLDNYSENLGLSWLPDGRLLFGSRASGNADLWVINADGSGPRQLTVEPRADAMPSVSADGRQIAFVSSRNGTYNIWRMDADGSNPKPVTSGPGETTPGFSPDGKWIVYSAPFGSNPVLWKVPVEGGEAIQLTDKPSIRPAVSPDGKLVAHLHMDEQSQLMKLAVVPLAGGAVRLFDKYAPEPPVLNWSPDGRMLTYIETQGGVSNIHGLPVDGSGPARPLTNFKSDRIFRFAWSGGGRKLACERGFYINDVVLISDFI